MGSGRRCRDSGSVFVSVANRDKRAMIFPVKRLVDLGFTILATSGTAEVLRRNGIEAKVVRKITEREPSESGEPSIVDLINDGEVADGRQHADRQVRASRRLRDPGRHDRRRQADHHDGAELAAAVQGIEARRTGEIRVKSLQDHARDLDLLRHAVAAGGS